MSIKDVAITFNRTIRESPRLEEIKLVVNKLKPVNNTISPAPVLGLLLYDQRKVKRYLGRSPATELSSWEARDVRLLFGVHNQIRRFNRLCLAPLELTLSEAIEAVNPYKEYLHPPSTQKAEELLFKQNEADEIINSFHKHPAFGIALSTLAHVQQRRVDYDQTVRQLNNEIVQAGPGGEPQWFKDYVAAKDSDHPNVELYRHIAALISLHNSLSNLDQLIYHGIFKDEFRPLNRTNIVDYFWTTGHVGPAMWLLHISALHMYVCELTDLIIVNVDEPEQQGAAGDRLCSVHSMTIPGTNGGPGEFGLRIIDENLNAYRNLIR